MSSNLAKAGFGIGILGVAAVLAVSIITLVKVNDNKTTTTTTTNNGQGYNNTIYNNTIYNNTIYNNTIYNNTIYNETIYAGNNETFYIYNETNTIYNNTIVEIYYMDNGTDPQAILNIPANSPANTVKYQQAAKFFANSIDTSVSPCDDFYQYACGKYTQDISFDIAEIDNRMKMANSLGNSINSGDPLPLQQIRKMYQQCTVDKPNMSTITANGTQILNIYRDYLRVTKLPFPLLSRNINLAWPNPTQTAQILGYLSGKYGVDTLISQYIDTNWKDPQGMQPYLLFLDQPTLSLPYTYYIGKTWDITKPSLTERVFQTFMNFNNITSPPLDLGLLNSTVNSIVNFEYLLANSYSSSDIVRWQSDRSYNLIRVGDFNKNFTSIDIYTFIKNIAIHVTDQNVLNRINNSNYEFSIAEPTQLLRMNYALTSGFNGSVTAMTFANYIYYRLLDANNGLFPQNNMVEGDEFLDMYKLKRPTIGRPRFEKNLRAKFSKKVDDVDQQTKLDCVDDTINQFQYANARIFIDVIYPTEASRKRIKTSVGHVVDSILVGMQSMIDQLSWMSADSKKGAYSKIQNLIRNIAYPEWITDNGNLTRYYSDLTKYFMNRTDYLTMLNDLNEFNARLYFDQLRRTRGTNRKEWNGPPGIVNAWYQPELNSISFPAAILRQPFFDPDWPASVNFGSMGVVAGHELSHGFDSSGTQWDGFGQLLGWLDPTSKQYFNNMTQCVINEYNGFCPLNTSYSPNCINGQQTVGENVADNGGIHSAFRAYRNAINYFGPDPLLPGDLISLLTHDQLFFLSFAQVWCQTNPSAASEYRQLLVDPHSPSKYRVLGTIQNFPAFRTAFNCPVNSASAPSDHCNVWISDVNITKEEASSNVLNVPDTPLIKADNNLYSKYSQAQAFFKAALNLSADPCNDFYSYACGSYNKPLSFYIYRDRNYGIMAGQLEAIQDGYIGDMADSTAIEMLSSFYKECKTVTAAMKSNNTLPEIKNGSVVQSVLDEFKAVTGYKFDLCETAPQNTNADPTVMAKALAFLSIKYGVDTIVTPFVDVNAQRNPAFAAAFTLYIDQNTVTYPKPYYQPGAWDAYTNKTLHANAMKLVENFVNSTGLQCNPGVLKKNIDAIISFEYSLATTYSTDDDTRRNFTLWINPMKVKDIPYTFADWKTYVSELARLTNVDFVKPTIADYLLLIAEPEKIAALNAEIPSVGIDTIVKYLYYRLLVSQKDYVYSPPEKSSYEALYHESGYALGEKTRKRDPYASAINVDDVAKLCAEATQDYMQYANARVFTEALYKSDDARQSIREQTRKVISAIRNSMQAMLDDLPWISSDPKTQEGARNKIMNLQLNLAFPDFIMNNTMLDEYHDQLNITDEDSYFTMVKKLQVFNQYQNYINLTSTYIDRSNFLGPPGTVNAWYQPEMNSITIPEGILQQPYFDPEWPASIKFGAMGVIIGHELTHGFDDQGVQWDGTGILKPWMSPDAQSSFHDMAQCVIDEYNNFTAITNSSYDPRNINGEQTQGENIADNGGIHSGYLSYQRWVQLNGPDPQLPDRTYGRFTHDQLFFLSFAQVWCQSHPSDDTTYRQLLVDPHSPSKFRVFGTIQNFPAFRQAFNCPVGSKYAPQDHCSVWVPENN